MYCQYCGAQLPESAKFCSNCGAPAEAPKTEVHNYNSYQESSGYSRPGAASAYQHASQQAAYQQPGYTEYNRIPVSNYSTADPSWPVKSKIAAGILGILLGGLGVHKFYLGKIGMGILYLLFCWTGVPAIIGLIEGIIYLCDNDNDFENKHHVRVQ